MPGKNNGAVKGVAGGKTEVAKPDATAEVLLAMAERDFTRLDTALVNSSLPKKTASVLRKRARELYAPVVGELKNLAKDSFINEIRRRRMMMIEAMTPEKISGSGLRDLVIAYGVLQDKEALLLGEPTEIVRHEDRRKIGELLPELVKEAKRRNLDLTKQPDGSYGPESGDDT